MKYLYISLCTLFFGLCLTISAKTVAFPGAEGFGRYTIGGRGGEVYHVTTLEDCSSSNLVKGTLRYGCQKKSGVTIVFDVSGTIHLTSHLSINKSNLTIAGQSAPGDGICVADYPVTIDASNIMIRYMRFRLGNINVAEHEGDGLGSMDHANIIIDHCSVSWSIDECLSVYGTKGLTVQWCLVAQSLRESGHSKGKHGYGGNWGGSGASYHHNLMCHHESRTPRLGPRPSTQTDERMDLRNNVFYNWAGNGCYGGEGMNVNIVNNFYKPGPATRIKGGAIMYRIAGIGIRTTDYCTDIKGTDTTWNGWTPMHHTWGKFFVDGNYINGNSEVTNDNWTKGIYAQVNNASCDYLFTEKTKDTIKLNKPIDYPYTTTHTAQMAYQRVLDYAGACLSRDQFDSIMIYDTRNNVASYGNSGGLPGIVDSQDDNKPANASADWSAWPTLRSTNCPIDTDQDGIPDEIEKAYQLNPNDASDGNLLNNEGYTMLEVYLNSLVEDITQAEYEGGVVTGEIPDTSSVRTDVTASWKLGTTTFGNTANYSKEHAFSASSNSYSTVDFNVDVNTTANITFTRFQPTSENRTVNTRAAVRFSLTPQEGLGFTPSIVSFDGMRYGTDGGSIDVAWIDSEGKSTIIASAIRPERNNSGTFTHTSIDLSQDRLGTSSGTCTLALYIYNLGTNKSMGLSNLSIGGELSPIDGLHNVSENQSITNDPYYYDVLGRRHINPSNGLYIHRGKKVFIK